MIRRLPSTMSFRTVRPIRISSRSTTWQIHASNSNEAQSCSTMEKTPSLPLVRRILADYCGRHGLSLICDEGSGQAGYIELADGRRRFFRGTHFDLNPLGAAEIADDKAYTLGFLKRDGFTVPDSMLVHGSDVLASLRVRQPEIAAKIRSAEDALHFAGNCRISGFRQTEHRTRGGGCGAPGQTGRPPVHPD